MLRCVRAYSAEVRDAALAQREADLVFSPLGIWLLVCACLPAAAGADRERLEALVGCSADDAVRLLESFLADAPSAIHAAVAVWISGQVETEPVRHWRERLPAVVERGPVPSQREADAWADRKTLGLIPRFPVDVGDMDVVLASALATKVSWTVPYDVASTHDRFPVSSPWRDAVQYVLWTEVTGHTAIVGTQAAGLVAVHEARAAHDGLAVICVSADAATDPAAVLAAAHEVGEHISAGSAVPATSLFDLPLGDGHSWTISERERPAWQPGQRFERIRDVALPAWRIHSELGLLKSPTFGATTATSVLGGLVGEGPADAKQVALATFDRTGFTAAAISTIARAARAPVTPQHTGVERSATMRFDHPFASVAVLVGDPQSQSRRFRGLPVFEAWVQTPCEVTSDQL